MPELSTFTEFEDLDPTVPASGPGCAECTEAQGWWVHLRRCAACGHVGCCDSSPGQHATAHYRQTGHPIIASFPWARPRELARSHLHLSGRHTPP